MQRGLFCDYQVAAANKLTSAPETNGNRKNGVSMPVCVLFMCGYLMRPPLWSSVRVLGYRSGGPGSIPGTTRKKRVVGLERGPLSLVSTTEELLDRKVAAPVYKTERIRPDGSVKLTTWHPISA
jgi:hypothetical protein